MKVHLETGHTISDGKLMHVTLCQRYVNWVNTTKEERLVDCDACRSRMNDKNEIWVQWCADHGRKP